MFGFLRKMFSPVAEVDGIKFYSDKSLKKYIEEREVRESRKGKHMYTFEIPWYQKLIVPEVRVILEKFGCFDYTIDNNYSGAVVKYWSPKILLTWKD